MAILIFEFIQGLSLGRIITVLLGTKDCDNLRQQYEQEYNHSRLRCAALGSGDHAIKQKILMSK
jgi:patatin-like phospholipase/acyl hydrolase